MASEQLRIRIFEFRVCGLGLSDLRDLGSRVEGLRLTVQDSGFRAQAPNPKPLNP